MQASHVELGTAAGVEGKTESIGATAGVTEALILESRSTAGVRTLPLNLMRASVY